MADYRDQYAQIRAAGANVVAVSVDSVDKSAAVRRDLQLPFAILCDMERRVVQDWDIYNAKEKGGIAKPAVFIIGPGRLVRFASLDELSKRVPASQIAAFVSHARAAAPTRKSQFPYLRDIFRAIRNSRRFGVKPPQPR